MTTEAIQDAAPDIEGTAIVTRVDAPPVSWTPSFAVAVDEAIERKREKRRFFEHVMDADLHYGVIPGTGTKPTLLKPGAEMLLSNMGLNATFIDAEAPDVDILGTDHGGEAYIRYRRICRIYRQLGPTETERMIVAEAAGSCSSWETKYRYRNDKLRCPECQKPTIIKAKDFSGQNRDLGWVCWKKDGKSDGCGTQYPAGDKRIAGQVTGKIPNPDVAELENTILKMADKRALVAATLIATGCSDIFTQDVEDAHSGAQDDFAGVPGSQDAPPPQNAPQGTETASTATLEKIVRGFNALDLTADRRGEFLASYTEGRVTASSGLAHLTAGEANRIVRGLVAAFNQREATEPCVLCTSQPGDPHFSDAEGWPCENDQSEAAMKVRADAVTLDSPRGPAATLEDEVDLSLPL